MDEIKRMDKGFMRKNGRYFLPVTHESLVLDNDGLSVDEKYLTILDAQEFATEDYVRRCIEQAQLGGGIDPDTLAKLEDLEKKVDKEEGKSLVSNEQIEKLATLENYDDTELRVLLANKAPADHNHDTKYASKDSEHRHINKAVLDEITMIRVNTWDAKSDFSGSYNDLTNKPEIPSIEGLATQEFVETRIQESARPNFDFKIHMMPQDTKPYVITTGEYPNLVVEFHIPSNNGGTVEYEIATEEETTAMYESGIQ